MERRVVNGDFSHVADSQHINCRRGAHTHLAESFIRTGREDRSSDFAQVFTLIIAFRSFPLLACGMIQSDALTS